MGSAWDFYNPPFLKVQIWVLGVKKLISQFLMDLHIFADPVTDPGSQNLADPADQHPKHWVWGNK